MASLITEGVRYAQLLDDFRALIRYELTQQQEASASQLPKVGGKELAREITRLSDARIYALVASRSIPHFKRGNRLFFDRAELIDWVKAGSRAVTTGKEVRSGR